VEEGHFVAREVAFIGDFGQFDPLFLRLLPQGSISCWESAPSERDIKFCSDATSTLVPLTQTAGIATIFGRALQSILKDAYDELKVLDQSNELGETEIWFPRNDLSYANQDEVGN
jgi:hypothetical protein